MTPASRRCEATSLRRTRSRSAIPGRNGYLAVTEQRIVIFGLAKMGKLEGVGLSFVKESEG